MGSKAERARRESGHVFRSMMDQTVTHVRVGQGRGDLTSVTLVGLASELHGLDGVCTCCPRRPAGELSGRQQSAAAARAAAHRAAELGPAATGVAPSVAVPLDELLDVPATAKDEAIARARAAAADSARRLRRRD